MGKKKQFNEAEVLSTITTYFWQHGYSATKVDQLAALTGLTKTSLYNAFGNKESLFIRVIDNYVTDQLTFLVEQIDLNLEMSKNLRKVLEKLFMDEEAEKLEHGCFLTNSLLELASNEPQLYTIAKAHFQNVRVSIRAFFAHYKDNGSLKDTAKVDELTDLFMTLMQGLRVQSRNGDPEFPLKHSIEMFLTLVKNLEIKHELALN